jgi:gamma-glutamyl hydrolase
LIRFGKTNGIPNEAINHSPDAVLASLYPATFFVNEARKSSHRYSSASEEDLALIYNYKPSKTTGSFVQTYFFHF